MRGRDAPAARDHGARRGVDRVRAASRLSAGSAMGDSIETVTGPVAGSDLGFTLVHEHVACASAGIIASWPSLYGGRAALIERAVGILARAKADGVDTIVDATPLDLGRDVSLLAECAERSGVRIIASSGHWLFPSPTIANRTTDQIARLFVSELTEG